MKKILKMFTLAIALFGAICLTSCSFDSVTSLAFSGLIKQEFTVNEALDVKVTITVDGASPVTKEIKVSSTGVLTPIEGYNFTIAGFNTTEAGTGTYTINLDGSTLSCYYVVVADNQEITGTGVQTDPYMIYNTTNFLGIQTKINAAADNSITYFKLANNLNFYGVDYDPIEVPAKKAIVFNGNGKTISNIDFTTSNSYKYPDTGDNALNNDKIDETGEAIFAEAKADITINSLVVDSVSFNGLAHTGILIGKASAKVNLDNVKITNSSAKGNKWIGGFVASTSSGAILNSTNCGIEDTILLAKAESDDVENVTDAKKVGSMVGMVQSSTIKVSNYECKNVEIYGSRDLGLIVGILQGTLELGGTLKLSGVNKVVATVTSGTGLVSSSGGLLKASAGAIVGTWQFSDTTVTENYKKGVKDFNTTFLVKDDFTIYAEETEVLFDRVNGCFAAGNRIENVLSVRSTDTEYANGYKTETFVRFIGSLRTGTGNKQYLVPFVK